jgi:photosystem II stability/assembly factor-like uncharacterized protein
MVAAVVVLAFVGVIAGLGAVSKSSPPTTTAAAATGSSPGTAPSVSWYWTMAVSPTDANTLVLGTSAGLYRSTDAGKTWAPVGPKGVGVTSVVQAGSLLYMGGVPESANAVPVIHKANARAAPDGAAVVAVSSDGGKTWKTMHPRGLPDVSVQSMAVSPTSSKTIYVLLNDGGLYRSTDGAASFEVVDRKIGIPPWALAITQGSHFVSGDMDAGPHTSSNAKAWQSTKYTDANGGRMVMEYAVQPSDPTRVLMTSIGVVISTDGGMTWHTALKSSVMFGPVAYAASAPSTAYAIGFDGSVWRSTDGGMHWAEVT